MTRDHPSGRLAGTLAARRRLAAVSALALALVIGGCGGGGGPKAAKLSTSEIVSRTVQSTSQVKSFHVSLTVGNAPTGSSGLTITSANGDLVVPDRLQAQVNGTLGSVALQTAIVIIGGQSFLKNPVSGKWQKYDLGVNPATFFNPSTGVLALIKDNSGLTQKGTETVDGVPTYRLSGQVPASALAPLLGSTTSGKSVPFTVWIGTKDFLLRRVRLAGPATKGDPQDIVRTIDITKFNEPVTITAPSTSG